MVKSSELVAAICLRREGDGGLESESGVEVALPIGRGGRRRATCYIEQENDQTGGRHPASA